MTKREYSSVKNNQLDLVQRIEVIRRTRDTAITKLSEETEIPYATLRRYLAGERNVPANALKAIAAKLDVSADWLLFGNPWPLDRTKLANALEEHDNLREVSGDKLSWSEYAEIFAKSYQHWNRPVPHGIRKEELASLGIELIVVESDSEDEQR